MDLSSPETLKHLFSSLKQHIEVLHKANLLASGVPVQDAFSKMRNSNNAEVIQGTDNSQSAIENHSKDPQLGKKIAALVLNPVMTVLRREKLQTDLFEDGLDLLLFFFRLNGSHLFHKLENEQKIHFMTDLVLIFQIREKQIRGGVGSEEDIFEKWLQCFIQVITPSLDDNCSWCAQSPPNIFAYVVTICLDFSSQNKFTRKFRLTSLRVLHLLVQVLSKEALQTMFPGITGGLLKIITGDQKQGHAIFCTAVDIFQRATIKCFSTGCDFPKDKLQKTFAVLFGLDRAHFSHSHPDVRKALAECAGHIAVECPCFWGICLETFLDTLAIFSQDFDYETASMGQKLLHQLLEALEKNQYAIKDLLFTNMRNLTKKLPRLVRGSNEMHSLVSLKVILGYITLLSAHPLYVDQMLNAVLPRITLALIQILEFDVYDVRLDKSTHNFVEQALREQKLSKAVLETADHFYSPSAYPEVRFKYFRNPIVLVYIKKLCQILGSTANLDHLFDHCITLLDQEAFQIQSVFILNEVVNGIGMRMNLDREALVEPLNQVAQQYFGFEGWKGASTSRRSIQDIHRDSLLVVLCLEGIGNIAQVLQRSFEDVLPEALYPLLEKLGHSDAKISTSAFVTLERISKVANTKSVEMLVQGHLDTLIDTIVHHIKFLGEFPNTPQLLLGILKYSDASIVHLLEDTIQAIFLGFEENPHQRETFFRVLNTLVSAWDEKVQAQQSPEAQQRLCDEIHPYTLQIMEKLQHFLALKDISLKVLVLDIMSHSVSLLAGASLPGILPAIHKLWAPLMPRLAENEPVVVSKTLELVSRMAMFSKDFLSSKFSDNLWPALRRLLSTFAKTPERNEFHPTVKTACAIFSNLAVIIEFTPVNQELVHQIAQATQPFFAQGFASQVYSELKVLWVQLQKMDPPATWLFLHQLTHTTFLPPLPSPFCEVRCLSSSAPFSLVKPKLNEELIRSLLL